MIQAADTANQKAAVRRKKKEPASQPKLTVINGGQRGAKSEERVECRWQACPACGHEWMAPIVDWLPAEPCPACGADDTKTDDLAFSPSLATEETEDEDQADSQSEILRQGDIVAAYLRGLADYQLLSRQEELDLDAELLACEPGSERDRFLRQKLVLGNLRFVVKMAQASRYEKASLLDLIQEGNIGLMKAAMKYDPASNNKFITYARHSIRRALDLFLRDFNEAQVFRLPGQVYEEVLNHKRYYNWFFQRYNRPPGSIEELADFQGIPAKQAIWLNSLSAVSKVGFNDPLRNKMNEDAKEQLVEVISSQETMTAESLFLVQEHLQATISWIRQIISRIGSLSEQKKEIFLRRYGLGEFGDPQTYREIGDRFSFRRQRAEQIIKEIWKRLKISKHCFEERLEQARYCEDTLGVEVLRQLS